MHPRRPAGVGWGPARRPAVESLVDLLPLLFIGLYYLLSARRRTKQKRVVAPQEGLVSDPEPRAPSPFESFLGQLEEAMAEAAGEPVDRDDRRGEALEPVDLDAPPEPLPAPADPAVPRLGAADAEFRAPAGSFDSPLPVDHEGHGFGPANPQSEESFEQAPAFAEPPPVGPGGYDPHGLRPPTPAPARPLRGWRQRLSDPQTAQNAFVLQTVFGPRGGRRAEQRH